MLILLLVLAFLLTFVLVAAQQKKNSEYQPALAFILTIIITSCFVFITTEVLSFFNAVTETALQICWVIYVTIAGMICLKAKPSLKEIFPANIKKLFSEFLFLKLAVLFILSISLLIALTAYPNTWDSMTYHLARIMHWLQNKNVEQYPTAIERQVSFQPFAEYCMLHCMAVSGLEKTANLVQWVFFCGNICVAYLLAGELGAGKKGKYLACFIVATLPMAILQSNSTQNDLTESFFITGSILFLIRCLKNSFSKKDILLFSISAGLACITKGTAYIYLLPVLLVFACAAFVQKRFLAILIGLSVICVILFFNGLYWSRNYQTYGTVTGPEYELQNRSITLNGFMSNVSRNVAMQLRLPFSAYNDALNNTVLQFHKNMHTDIEAASYTWPGTPAFLQGQFTTQEDSAGSFLHVLMLVIFFPLCFILYKKHNKYLLLTAVIVFVMFILFCLLLRWQVWHVRLHLPMLVSGSIICACMMERWNRKILAILCSIFFLYSLVFLFYNYSRPLVGSKNIFYKSEYNQYFFTNMKNQQPFFQMSAIIEREELKNIGWVVSGDSWEFPMWLLLREEKNITMQHILVQNATKKIEEKAPFSSFIPDAIISTTIEPDSLGQMHYKNKDYYLTYKSVTWKLYQDITTLDN